MADDRPWGWWTAFDKQAEWLREVTAHINFPDEHLLDGLDDIPPSELSARLQEAGAALVYLQAQQGLMLGRAYALKETLEEAMKAAKQRTKLPKTATEAAKEGEAYNDPDIGEALRDTKRRHIEIQTCILAQAGLIKAYEAAWDTISRALTATGEEIKLASGRAS